MPRLTKTFGFLLLALGIVTYVATGMASPTALIPSVFGLLFAVMGFVADKPSLRKHAMHVCVVLALLAIGGSYSGLPELFKMMSGQDIERPAAAVEKSAMAISSFFYFIACVRSFVEARMGRSEG